MVSPNCRNFVRFLKKIDICGAKGIGDLGPLHIKPMAHAKEEEMSEDKHRKSRLLGYTAEDNPVLGEP